MLLVGFLGHHRHGGGIGFLEVFLSQFGIGLAVIREALPEPLAAEAAYARPDEEIGDQSALGELDEEVGKVHEADSLLLGKRGKKDGVRST